MQFSEIYTTRVFCLLSLHPGGCPAFFSFWLLTPHSPECSAGPFLLRNQSTHVLDPFGEATSMSGVTRRQQCSGTLDHPQLAAAPSLHREPFSL